MNSTENLQNIILNNYNPPLNIPLEDWLVTFRNILYNQILDIENDAEINYTLFYSLLDTCFKYSLNGIFDQNIPFLLIEDSIDILPISSIEKVLDYLESHYSLIIHNLEPGKGKALVLLRICNEALRKLSKSENSITCGRIQMLLALLFPLNERSGVNFKGEFHSENKTEFENDLNSHDMISLDDSVDSQFYKMFWSVQKYLSKPIALLDTNEFNTFKNSVETIMNRFSELHQDSTKSVTKRKKNSKESKIPKMQAKSELEPETPLQSPISPQLNLNQIIPSKKSVDYFFPKFLTSKMLFKLELQDSTFKRQIITQFIFILQFLSTLTPSEFEKSKQILEQQKITPNKFVSYPKSMTSEQESWIKETKLKCFKALDSMGEKSYSRSLQYVTLFETNWVKWKLESCPSFEKESVDLSLDVIRHKLSTSMATQKSWLGNEEMTWLWEQGKEVYSILSLKGRSSKVPLLSRYISELDYQIKPDGSLEDGLEDEKYVLYNDMTYNWRGFRIAHQKHLGLFENTEIDSSCPGKSLLAAWRLSQKESSNDTESQDFIVGNQDSILPMKRMIENIQENSDSKKLKFEQELI